MSQRRGRTVPKRAWEKEWDKGAQFTLGGSWKNGEAGVETKRGKSKCIWIKHEEFVT